MGAIAVSKKEEEQIEKLRKEAGDREQIRTDPCRV